MNTEEIATKAIRNKAVRDEERDSQTRYVLHWAKKMKAFLYKGNKCVICGNRDFRVFSFHHADEKNENIDTLFGARARWERIKKEIDICMLVCKNCHRELHDKENRNERQKQNKVVCLIFLNQFNCSKCRYSKIDTALHFHHVNRKEKENGIAELGYRHAWRTVADLTDDIVAELNKCIVLCCNCHRIEHFDSARFGLHRLEIEDKATNLVDKQKVDARLVVDMAKRGLNKSQIAEKTGYSPCRIYEIMGANNLLIRRKITDIAAILKCWENGNGVAETIQLTGYSEATIRVALVRAMSSGEIHRPYPENPHLSHRKAIQG